MCWCPELGETEDDGGRVRAVAIEDAAEQFARSRYSGDPFPDDGVVVCVRRGPAIRRFRVSEKIVSNFYAIEETTHE